MMALHSLVQGALAGLFLSSVLFLGRRHFIDQILGILIGLGALAFLFLYIRLLAQGVQ